MPKKVPTVGLNDYWPVTLTLVIMKCFKRLVLWHIKGYLPPTFDPHQFANQANRSTEDTTAIALHSVLSHLEQQQRYVRMLCVDYSSTFNTILLGILTASWVRPDKPIGPCPLFGPMDTVETLELSLDGCVN